MKELQENVIGAIVVVAIILAGVLGTYLVLKPVGQAYRVPEVCSCGVDGISIGVLYKEGYVFLPDSSSRYVGEIGSGEYMCDEICANIGGHA